MEKRAFAGMTRCCSAVVLATRASLPRRRAPVGVKVPANQRFVLPNGLTIVLVPRKDVPLIAFSGFVRGGALADPADKPGVASLVAGLLDRGAGKRNATNSPMRSKAWAAASTRRPAPKRSRSTASSWRAIARS
jgi:predicted Zn-dependent peptidase